MNWGTCDGSICSERWEEEKAPSSVNPCGRADVPWEHFCGVGADIGFSGFAGSHLLPSFLGHFCCHQKLSHPQLMASQSSSSISIFRDTRRNYKTYGKSQELQHLTLSDVRAIALDSCSAFHTSRGSGEVRDAKCVHLEGKKLKRR